MCGWPISKLHPACLLFRAADTLEAITIVHASIYLSTGRLVLLLVNLALAYILLQLHGQYSHVFYSWVMRYADDPLAARHPVPH